MYVEVRMHFAIRTSSYFLFIFFITKPSYFNLHGILCYIKQFHNSMMLFLILSNIIFKGKKINIFKVLFQKDNIPIIKRKVFFM